MAKLDPLAPLTSTYGAVSALNANFTRIAAALNNTLSLDGSTPNLLQAPLDLNHFNINNVAPGVNSADAVNLSQLLGTFNSIAAGKPGPATYAQPQDFGALGITDSRGTLVDESVAIQAMIDSAYKGGTTLPGLPGGGIVELGQKKSYYVNQTIDLREFITLQGRGFGRDEILGASSQGNYDKTHINYGSIPGTLILGPTCKILRGDHSGIRDLAVVSASAAAFKGTPGTDTTVAQVEALLASYSNYPLAVDTKYGACGTFVDNCFIAGFTLGIKQVYNERWRVSWTKFDCINDFYATQTYDDSRLFSNHSWPFVWGHRFNPTATGQSDPLTYYGTGFKFDKTTDPSRSIDAGHVMGNLFYGKLIAIDLGDTNGLHVIDNWIDNSIARPDTANTTGIRVTGNCRRTKLIGNHIDSHGRSIDCQGSGVILDMNTTCGSTVSHVRIGAGSQIKIGLHHMQGGSPQYFELTEGLGWLHCDSLTFTQCSGIAIALSGGGLPSAGTRANVHLGSIKIYQPGGAWSFDPRQWRSFVQGLSTADQPLPAGSYVQVIAQSVSNGSSPIDGYGEFQTADGTFIASSTGFYRVSGLATIAAPANCNIATQLRLNGIAQVVSQYRMPVATAGTYTCASGAELYMLAGDRVALFAQISGSAGGTLGSGQCALNVFKLT